MNVRDLIPWSRKAESRPVPYRDTSSYGHEVSPFLALHREMNRLFDDVFRGLESGGFGSLAGWPGSLGAGGWPHVEISESEREIKVCAELPGLEEKDVELLLEDDTLVLRGEKHSESHDAGARQFSERFYGRFERHIPLPAEIEEDKVSASFRNGVLTVTMPKTARAQARSRRIAINGKH